VYQLHLKRRKEEGMFKGILVPIALLTSLALAISFSTAGDCLGSGFNPPKGHVLYSCAPESSDLGRAVAIQLDGKIVVAGTSYDGKNHRALVLRFKSDGTLDNTFGTGGVFTHGDKNSESYYNGVVLQPDGKIVVVGHSSYRKNTEVVVLRCNADGSLDTTFGKGGVVTYKSRAKESQDLSFGVMLQPDTKVIVVSASYNGKNFEAMMLRYNNDGTADGSFGKGGVVTYGGSSNADIYGRAVAIQLDGKIVLTGVSYSAKKCDILTMRYDTDGSLDKKFGEGGVAVSSCPPGGRDFGRSIAVQRDGKIVVAGNTISRQKSTALLLRYDVDGRPDKTFGTSGFADDKSGANRSDSARAVALLPDGKILIAGYTVSGPKADALIIKYNSDGTLDSSFGKGGVVISNCLPNNSTWAFAAAIQADGRIVVVGHAQLGKNRNVLVMRYKTDGTLDAPL
jgi:uncharacterized delta-60 repeat protein